MVILLNAITASLLLLTVTYGQVPALPRSGPAIVEAFRKSSNIYSDTSLNLIVNQFIREAPAFDEERLSEEFDTFWRAARTESKNELLQAAFFGTATSLFVLNRRGQELGRRHLGTLLDMIETVPARAQISLGQAISRIDLGAVPGSAFCEPITRIAFRIEPFAGDLMIAPLMHADPGCKQLLRALAGLLDMYEQGSLPPSSSGKVYSYLAALSDGSANLAVLELVERIAATRNPSWQPMAMKVFASSLSRDRANVTKILNRLESR